MYIYIFIYICWANVLYSISLASWILGDFATKAPIPRRNQTGNTYSLCWYQYSYYYSLYYDKCRYYDSHSIFLALKTKVSVPQGDISFNANGDRLASYELLVQEPVTDCQGFRFRVWCLLFDYRGSRLRDLESEGTGVSRSCLEGQGDLVSRLITPITHIVTLVIPSINQLTKSP